PGDYYVSRNLPDVFYGGYVQLGDSTTSVRYTITADSTIHVDLDPTVLTGDHTRPDEWNRCDLLFRWNDLATGTCTGGTITVELSNLLSSGKTYADAIRVERVADSFASSGDTVVLNARDSWIETVPGTTGPEVNRTVPILSDDDWLPYDPDRPRSLRVG